MLMGMTGTSSSSKQKTTESTNGCPMMGSKDSETTHTGGSSGGQEPTMDF